MLEQALAAIDPDAVAADVAALVQVPSLTGDERAAVERFAELAAAQGLAAEVVEHDLAALRAHPGHPGEEAGRTELTGAVATLAGADGAPRLCLNGHLDVVAAGEQPWARAPFSGAIEHGCVHGRGAVDMKGGLVAALHAAGAVARTAGVAAWEVTFAALERDDRFDAALIPEPTAFQAVVAQAGALTFTGVVPGVAAHAAVRLEGVSAIDRYVPVHAALAEHERQLNADVSHPLLRSLHLPYPVLVGRVDAGRWSSQVPDRLVFEGRVGVPVGVPVEDARAALEAVVRDACPDVEIAWTGGQFAPGTTDAEHPFVRSVVAAGEAELGTPPPLTGVPYGSDMRLFCERGIPCLMLGPSGLELAHAVDERVRIDELVALARLIVRVLLSPGGGPGTR
jgi:acetylornithine deacetylase